MICTLAVFKKRIFLVLISSLILFNSTSFAQDFVNKNFAKENKENLKKESEKKDDEEKVVKNNLKKINSFFAKIDESENKISDNLLKISEQKKIAANAIFEKNKILKKIESEITDENFSDLSNEDLLNFYNKINDNWRILADNSLEFFSQNKELIFKFPQFFEAKNNFPEEVLKSKKYKNHQKNISKINQKYQELEKIREDFIDVTQNYQSKIFLKIEKKRSEILTEIIDRDPELISYKKDYISDLTRELKLVKYRPLFFFYEKLLFYQDLLAKGVDGYIEILSQIFFLIFLTIVLFVGTRFLNRFVSFVNGVRERYIKSSIQNEGHKIISKIISKFLPYLPWIFLIIIFDSIFILMGKTALPELAAILPLFIFYFCYKIFKILFLTNLSRIAFVNFYNSEFGNGLTAKIHKTTKILGYYLYSVVILLYLTQLTLGKSLVFYLIINISYVALSLLSFVITNNWKDEILFKFNENFKSENFKKLANFLSKKIAIFPALFLLIFLTIKFIFNHIILQLNNSDYLKRIFAQIYQKKLESAAKNIEEYDKNLPREYSKIFENNIDELLYVKSQPLEEVQLILEKWLDKKARENSMVIVGEDGIGKSAISKAIQRDVQKQNKDLKVINIKITGKIITKESFERILIKDLDISGENVVKEIEEYKEKILIIFDNAHNLFLSKRNGLDAFKYFSNLINLSSENIFWISIFSKYSWNYLFNAIDHSKYFRYKIRISRWSDIDIKNLILQAHKKGGYKLSYDTHIFDIQTRASEEEIENIQEKFFQILWSQSRGNPRTAISLWLSSLSYLGNNKLKISLPKSAKYSDLLKLNDNSFFIYSAIAKHQNLTINEIISVTDLPKGAVLNSVRFGLEKGYLIEEKGRFILSDFWKIQICNMLINKNYIYE
jgi:hypothetical protein